MEEQRYARATAGRLVSLARSGELDAVAGSLSLLTYAGAGKRERLRRILAALIEATGSMMLAMADSVEARGGFGVDLRRTDQSTVDIDEIEPPVRATIRALLAHVNHAPLDAADQVELAVAGGDDATVEVIVLALTWAVNAAETCEDNGLPLPDWLRLENA